MSEYEENKEKDKENREIEPNHSSKEEDKEKE